MKEIKISLNMIDKARSKAEEMGKLQNSILKGKGNIAGFIGEQIALECLGGTWDNTYSHDIVLPNGKKVDVKTKQTSVAPLPDYDCSVANFNTKQACDTYAFVRVKNDFTVGWYLGSMNKKEYLEKAIFMKKGDVDPSNNYTVRADCYNLKIKQLHV
tara:strand:- start:13702 stop:14172 length:471 start_codon:yes stop_codon:yes gene_type:complete